MRKITSVVVGVLVVGGLVVSLGRAHEARAASSVTLTFEAEGAQVVKAPFSKKSGTLKDKRKPRPQTNSGGAYLQIPKDAKKQNDTVAEYRVKVPASGNYYVWARFLWPNGCGNSVYFAKKGSKPVIMGEDGTYDAYHWMKLAQPVPLQKGTNTLQFQYRESGIIIDQVQLTTNSRAVPTGSVKPTSGVLE